MRQRPIVILRMKIENYSADCITILKHMVSFASESRVKGSSCELSELRVAKIQKFNIQKNLQYNLQAVQFAN